MNYQNGRTHSDCSSSKVANNLCKMSAKFAYYGICFYKFFIISFNCRRKGTPNSAYIL
ncbi:conserved domain protein [Acinetobacter baumannii 6013113]|nr:conserved domain protein [Acinetobacter baumannii 6013113]